MSTSTEEEMIPAVPPNDYKGSIACWMLKLKERGHIDPTADINCYPDVEIPVSEWWEILEACSPAIK